MNRLQKKTNDIQPEFKLIVRSDTASLAEAPLSAPAVSASEPASASAATSSASATMTPTPTTPTTKTHGWSARRSIDQILHPLHHHHHRDEQDQQQQQQHHRSRSASASSAGTTTDVTTSAAGALSPTPTARMKSRRRLSQRVLQRLGLGDDDDKDGQSSREKVQGDEVPPLSRTGDNEFWERRATMLAGVHDEDQPQPQPPTEEIASRQTDQDIQEAIRLHEAGSLEQSTAIFARLADPSGANNALSQVLYGLALRHGWGCRPDPEAAVRFLSAAASSAASVEQLALHAGLARGGAAKGELVLAIFELANCFRNGWGVPMDAVAAKQYYETAANLGDTDAMNEAAWCYLKGFGCRKDKFAAARYYRLAEKAGSKTLGNSWIWKEKYDPPANKTP
ncbi:hypothetical protein CP533_0349 [Ophiocordyceps camponoti-saundersi (nom. inval.)]|nr:hypothetical protein CP533_0349 [Ophiocordyceps camponoti-saundersi (nom. inval.)]